MVPDTFWERYPNQPQTDLAATLKQRLRSQERVSFTVKHLSDESGQPLTVVRALLDDIADAGYLRISLTRPCPHCRQELTEDDITRLRCSCGLYLEEHALPESHRVYIRDGGMLRDIRWALAVHGMNTPGAWQQDVSWRLSQMYGYSIPVAIYKYGNIKLSPFVPVRQKVHRERLLMYLRKVRDEMRLSGFGERPDVIAHSFGTWLIGEAMKADTSDDPIKLGRVVLTGSIVRPDFDWQGLLSQGRVESVLCHCALRDVPVKVAHFFIPGSGPSGTRGFNDHLSVLHTVAPDFGHSDFFSESNLPRVMKDVWAPFLRQPIRSLVGDVWSANSLPKTNWKPSRVQFVTRSIKGLALLAIAASLAFFTAAAILGTIQLLS